MQDFCASGDLAWQPEGGQQTFMNIPIGSLDDDTIDWALELAGGVSVSGQWFQSFFADLIHSTMGAPFPALTIQ